MGRDIILNAAELLDSLGIPLSGSLDCQEAVEREVLARFPHKPYCLVEEWTIFRANVSDDDLAKIHEAGHIPLFVFAHKVVQDSRGRFQPGQWVRSSMAISFDGLLFETKNTAYALMGTGHEKKVSLKTIFSIF